MSGSTRRATREQGGGETSLIQQNTYAIESEAMFLAKASCPPIMHMLLPCRMPHGCMRAPHLSCVDRELGVAIQE